MPRGRIRTQPCPVCAGACEVKRTKKGKPYWQCDDCGVQVFVRGHAGIERMDLSVRERERDELDFLED